MNPARQFLALTPQRRALVFEQAVTQRSIDPVIMGFGGTGSLLLPVTC